MNVIEQARAYDAQDQVTLSKLAKEPHNKRMHDASAERAENRMALLDLIARQEKQIARLLATTKELRAENGALRHRIRAAVAALDEPAAEVIALVRERLEVA
ncbi:MAG: hypothetical protein WCD38_11775 [Candidatus Tumulicola sp.]